MEGDVYFFMFYSKQVIIKQLQYKYKISENAAIKLYEQYQQKDELNILFSLLFDK